MTEYALYDGDFTVKFSVKDSWIPILAYENGKVYRIWFIFNA